jgi:basic amino acid/polyamine antiporter, APA family
LADTPTLLRAVGTRRLAISIFNTVVGAGIFVLPASVAGLIGAGAPFAYLACTVAILLVALCFAAAGSRVSAAGGAYAYVSAGLGPWPGVVTGVLQWLSDTLSWSSVAAGFAAAVTLYVPAAAGGPGRVALLAVVLGALAAINVRGVRQSTTFLEGVTVVKLAPLVLFVAMGAGLALTATVRPAVPAADTLARTTLVLLFAYAGVESALALSGEVVNPSRAVPRAVLTALVAISALYMVVHFIAVAALGDALAGSATAPLADAGGQLGGTWLRQVMLAGTTLSMFGYLSALALASPRLLYSLGSGGMLPAALARVHPRFRTPWIAILTQTALVVAIASTGTFAVLVPMASVAILSVYLLVCLAAWRLQRIDRSAGAFSVPAVVPAAGVVVILWMLASARWHELALEGTVVAGASLLYFLRRASARA